MTHLTHFNEAVPMKVTQDTVKIEYAPLERISSLLGIPDFSQNQEKMYNNEYYGKSRLNSAGWKSHYDRSEDIIQEPTKFNVEIDFNEQLECKKEKEIDMSSSNWFIEHFASTKYVCSNCDQELMYNRKDDFRYCPACTEGYSNG
jgi:uncharacterized CHY-type Zn-finger protein